MGIKFSDSYLSLLKVIFLINSSASGAYSAKEGPTEDTKTSSNSMIFCKSGVIAKKKNKQRRYGNGARTTKSNWSADQLCRELW
jgi:hypothetical protein